MAQRGNADKAHTEDGTGASAALPRGAAALMGNTTLGVLT